MPVLPRLGFLVACIAAFAPDAPAQGVEVGFVEKFALSPDRRIPLSQLVPGTADFYYYHCLQRQHEGDLAAVEPLLKAWVERHGRDERVVQIENRQALLSWPRDPEGTRAFLVRRLGLAFDHQRDPLGEVPDLPTRLDPGLVGWEAFAKRALEAHPGSLKGFEDSALRTLAARDLDAPLLPAVLDRLGRPDVPRLPELVARALRQRTSRGFGSLGIHGRLLLPQLEELAAAMPELLGDSAFVQVWLERLAPNPDLDGIEDPQARLEHLERLQAFAERLSPAFNSLKARILYHRLEHDLRTGRPDLERFRAYLRLPRKAAWAHPRILEDRKAGEELADLRSEKVTILATAADDEPLVRAWLEHFLLTADSPEAFAQLLRKEYLERVFAEIKLLHGVGNQERWYALLDSPALVERIEKRVELLFAPTQARHFAAGDPVAVELDVKNVPTLLVKVYEIDALSFYRAEGREVDASIALDGLVANEERTFTYAEPPLRRVRRRFEFPELSRPGVFVLELIGNGSASRVVVRKGGLQVLSRSGAAGQVLTVLDETGARRPDAVVHLGTHRYTADERGEVVLPFSTAPGSRKIAIEAGERAALWTLDHQGESYVLKTGFLVDREALRSGHVARVVVRPALTVNGAPASVKLLEDPVLSIETVDLLGVKAVAEVRGLELGHDGELVHEFQVPAGLRRLAFALRGSVKSLSGGEPLHMSSLSESIELNVIDTTERTWSPLLGRSAAGHFLDLLGKNGEPKADQPLRLRLTHRDFTDPLEVVLKSDAAGRIHLGALEGIVRVEPMEIPGVTGWSLEKPDRWPVTRVSARAGDTLRIPYTGRKSAASREHISLLELRGKAFLRDAFEHVALAEGYVELRDLPAGDYSLRLEESGTEVTVLVTAGEARDDLAVGRRRVLERSMARPLHVTELTLAGDAVSMRIAGGSDLARVHVLATRYLPALDPLTRLRVDPARVPRTLDLSRPQSDYHSGREIGDELRYVLDRRLVRRFPGNMLRRPGLILNPWSLEETTSMLGLGGGAAGKFGGRFGGARGSERSTGEESRDASHNAQRFANLDFLAGPTALLTNLRPDRDGNLRVPLAELGNGILVHVLAADAGSVARGTLALPERPQQTRDRRLEASLDPARHFSEHRGIELLRAGGQATLAEGDASTFRTYGSLTDVFGAFRALRSDVDIEPFQFLLRWPRLTPEEKRELYSKHACHELHFFLHAKDRAFFDAVVRPYLAQKLDKTFLDRWLLEEPLEGFVEPWRYARLNTLERILLARRLGLGDRVQRQIGEVLELTPVDPEEEAARFSTLLLGRALEVPAAARTIGFFAGPSSPGPASPGPASPGGPPPKQGAEEEIELLEDAPMERRRSDEVAGADLKRLGYGSDDVEMDARRRSKDKALFRAVDLTRAYAEHNWWRTPIEEHDEDLIEVNRFWSDYARSALGAPFLSTHFAEATGNVAEMLCALAVLDLPFEAGEPAAEASGAGLVLRAATPLLLVRKELREAKPASGLTSLLVSQDFFRLDDRYRFEGSKRLDKLAREGFVAGVAYGCRVVATNPSSAPEEMELLLQIPQGALPLAGSVKTQGLRVELEPYETHSHEYAFYFPLPGRFPHHPVQVTREGELLAAAAPVVLEVLARPAEVDGTSWEHVSQRGTLEQVLAYLEEANLERLDLGRLAWRMRERAAFERILAHLRERLVFSANLWSYGLLHGDERAMREFLHQRGDLSVATGGWLRSPLLDIDPVEQRLWQHLEFEPLVHGRAHLFGPRRKLLDGSVAAQYLELLEILSFHPVLRDREWMTVTYHLLLQDRVEEALESFARVDPAALESRLQHAYMSAYVAFYTEDLAAARRVAAAHREHPVARWRALFQDVLNQLDEAEGGAARVSDDGDLAQRQGQAAAAEPALALAVEGRTLRLSARNLERCELRYHPMDIEFLFSTSPFVQQGSTAAVYVRPHRVDVVEIPASGELVLELPEEYRNGNVLVEARGGGLTRRKPSVASSLDVHWMEGYGQLAVHRQADARPLSKVYVKVFARLPDGSVRFHKDGYTDVRGRFDYASLSGAGAADVSRFAVLVHSDDSGAVVAEVAPPAR